MPTLYLIPAPISEQSLNHMPHVVHDTIRGLDYFIVEKVRTARRFIRSISPDFDIDGSTFYELDKRDHQHNDKEIREILSSGRNIGLMSEAGLPCIADPGNKIVDLARSYYYSIVPLTGPSSIFMALMASGLNGQQFTFHGYLPIKEPELIKKLKTIQGNLSKSNYTHIFIETPYRNQKLYRALISKLPDHMKLCIAQEISALGEDIQTKTIKDWKRARDYNIGKVPCIFLLN